MARPIAVAVSEVELRLRPAEVSRARRILVPALLAKEIARHMLHRIEPKAVAPGLVDRPADRADQHAVHIFRHRIAHVVASVPEAPRRRLMTRHTWVHAGVG